jgi:hypothetical protein
MTTAAKLLREALELDEADRAQLALHLFESVTPPDPRDEAEWIAEVERRAKLAIADPTSGTPLGEALDAIQRELGL